MIRHGIHSKQRSLSIKAAMRDGRDKERQRGGKRERERQTERDDKKRRTRISTLR
jgi:hypothetical protein